MSRKGFTLVELLIVIGILAILTTITVLLLNPAQMIAQSRDSTRLNDLQTLNKAISLSKAMSSFVDSTVSKKVYVSLEHKPADPPGTCDSYSLPALATGWDYRCVADSVNLRKINGAGWIPIDFDSVSSIQPPLVTLPVDPINNPTNLNYYAYGWDADQNTYALAAKLDSVKYLDTAANDGGNWNIAYETRPMEWLGWSCGDVIAYSGQNYNTIQIGSQCWFKQYLNVGTMTAGANNQGTSCSSILKYCYNNNEVNCTSDGGFYQWNQVMCGSTTPGNQGICPSGWHIPTDAELCTLEQFVDSSITCDSTGWRGTNGGTKLKVQGGSGFDALLAGYRSANGFFYDRGGDAFFWSSVESGAVAWRRGLYSSEARVYRVADGKALGYSVRCLKD